jgi:[ribosomal protein S18]-alanine N-acetyltransferase
VREAIGTTEFAVAVVARLLVSPTARRQGISRALLANATGDATARGLRPIVDVATHYKPAIELYEAAEWIRIGTVTVHLPDRAAWTSSFISDPSRPVARTCSAQPRLR